MIIIASLKQGSKEWFQARHGRPTSSGFKKIITPSGKKSQQFDDYAFQLASERIAGEIESGYKSKAMDDGNKQEPLARVDYEFITDNIVDEVGIIYPDNNKKYACSPDGIVLTPTYGNEHIPPKKGLEIKCPFLKTHLKYLHDKKVPSEYYQQVQGSMLVTGFKEWDFMSYHKKCKPLIITEKINLEFTRELHLLLMEMDVQVSNIVTDTIN